MSAKKSRAKKSVKPREHETRANARAVQEQTKQEQAQGTKQEQRCN